MFYIITVVILLITAYSKILDLQSHGDWLYSSVIGLERCMAEWSEQVSQLHEMYCHDLKVISSNSSRVELGVHAQIVCELKIFSICRNRTHFPATNMFTAGTIIGVYCFKLWLKTFYTLQPINIHI